MSARHKVFVSYHHENDQNHKNIFNLKFGNRHDIVVKGSVELGDLNPESNTETIRRRIRDEYLADSSVTLVLVGTDTWRRKHVDWEIYSSLRDTTNNPRSGLLGVLLPSYLRTYGTGPVDPETIPGRLADNVRVGFASLHDWSEDPEEVQRWIHDAYLRKSRVQPDNSRPMFARNRTSR